MPKSIKAKMIVFVILGGALPLISGVVVSYFFSIGELSPTNLLWLVTAITTAFILAIGLPLTRSIGRPIAQVSLLCQQIISGELADKIDDQRRDEIGVLSESLHRIAAFLHNTRVELEQREKKYEALMAKANDAIILCDPESGRILEANLKCEEITGFTVAELTEMNFADLHPASEEARINGFFNDIHHHGQVDMAELSLLKKGGEIAWVDSRSSLIKYDEAGVVQSILRDTTDSRQKFILSEKEISFIHEMSRILPLFQDFDSVLERVLVMLGNTMRYNAFTLVIVEDGTTKALTFVAKGARRRFVQRIQTTVGDVLGEFSDGLDAKGLRFEVNEREAVDTPEKDGVGSQILLPLSATEGMAGLFSDRPDAFKKEDISLFSTLVSGISSIYTAYKAYRLVQELSITDALTGLYNRRKFAEELEREMERSRRYGSKLTMLMLDIDHFKKVNDTFGHQAGDIVLSQIAQVLIESTRKTDTVARYGGEEFSVLLPETNLQGAIDVANRIRERVEAHEIRTKAGPIRITVSLGLAARESEDVSDTLIARTDKALYQAKTNGRNRIEFPVAV